MEELERSGKVLMGTCGWSDHTLLKCGRFYPASVRSGEDRLSYYSNHFPCVEVDTSTYAIPSKASIKTWLRCVPKGFLFHFKAFGLFCSKSCAFTALPSQIRECLLERTQGNDYVHLNSFPISLKQQLWDIFNSMLQSVHENSNLGVIVFQFHLSFKPTKENQQHVEWCRECLDSSYSMAVEFRCREWFSDQHLSTTVPWLEKLGIALVAADELQHETFQKDSQQTGLPKGQEKVILPVAWAVTQPSFMYIRLHRREGSQRLLSESELLVWANRLKEKGLSRILKGPIYFLWGTDWEDQPIINAKELNNKLETMAFDWKRAQKFTSSKKRLPSFFRGMMDNKVVFSSDNDYASLHILEPSATENKLQSCNPCTFTELPEKHHRGTIPVSPSSAFNNLSSKRKHGEDNSTISDISSSKTPKLSTLPANASSKKITSPITKYFQSSRLA